MLGACALGPRATVSHMGVTEGPRDTVLCGLQQISALLPTMRTRVAACQPGSSLGGSRQISSLGSLALHHGLTQITGLRDIHLPHSDTQRPSSCRLCFALIAFVVLVVLVLLCNWAPSPNQSVGGTLLYATGMDVPHKSRHYF